jgi:uncharacterized protein (DUF1778 family)
MKAKRHPISFRCNEDLYRMVHAAAEASGRSVAQEIEFRLEMDFFAQRVIALAMREGT